MLAAVRQHAQEDNVTSRVIGLGGRTELHRFLATALMDGDPHIRRLPSSPSMVSKLCIFESVAGEPVCSFSNLFSLRDQTLLQTLNLRDHFKLGRITALEASPPVDVHGVLQALA